MKYVPLSSAAIITMGQSPPSDTYNEIGEGLPFFQGKADFGDLYPTISTYCSAPKKKAVKGDILISVRAPVGPTNINPEKSCIGRGLASIRPIEGTHPKYLLYFLRFYEPILAESSRGSTFDAIGKADLTNIAVPLPSIHEQQHIVTILDRADRLRLLRQYALELGDSYPKSVFLEMFYTQPETTWPEVTVSSVAKRGRNAIRTGPFGSQLKHSEFVEKGIRVLGIDNAVNNRFDWGKPRFITEEKYEQLKRYTVFPGDVIITIMATTGRCAIIPKNFPLAINTKHLCCITLDAEKCLPTYLKHCFLTHPSVLGQLGVSERGAVMPGLNMGIIKRLVIPVPPLEQQEIFSRIIQRYKRLHSQKREALRQAEHLFQSLLARAFEGNLL